MPPLVAIPNVSEGRDARLIHSLARRIEAAGAVVLDKHSDRAHNRTVYTVSAVDESALVPAIVELCDGAAQLDLTRHSGAHPRLGAVDVCPFVPHEATIDVAIDTARAAAAAITRRTGLPVYLYGAAALRPEARELPDIRRGGLQALIARAKIEFPPDFGPRTVDPARGVVCVGARRSLIAFNVWIRADVTLARQIAARVRSARGPGFVRALGLDVGDSSTSQVSMNLIAPASVGIDDAFAMVEVACTDAGTCPVATEIVGLVPVQLLPDPNGKAARLLIKPGRSLESALADHGLGDL